MRGNRAADATIELEKGKVKRREKNRIRAEQSGEGVDWLTKAQKRAVYLVPALIPTDKIVGKKEKMKS